MAARRLSPTSLSLALIVVLLAPPLLAPAPARAGGEGPDRVIVLFGPTLPANAADVVRQAGGTVVETFPQIGMLVAEAIGTSAERLIGQLQTQPGISGAGVDVPVELIKDEVAVDAPAAAAPDEFYLNGEQWSLKRIGAHNPGAWTRTKGAGAVIAILDTGVSSTHPDLQGKLVMPGISLLPPEWNETTAEDLHGHGTWVTGIAAGIQGGGAIVGVAPEARILNIKVANRFGASMPSLVADGIMRAADMGADVINISVGGLFDLSTPEGRTHYIMMKRAARYALKKGALIVASAGNFPSLDLKTIKGSCPFHRSQTATNCNLGYWAHLPSDLDEVIAAIATTNPAMAADPRSKACDQKTKDCLAFYSNFGKGLDGLAAPGGDGFTREKGVLGACSGSFFFCNGRQYTTRTGTSGAAPHISGTAALIRSIAPRLPARAVRKILERTAQDLGKKGNDPYFNNGLVRADRAVNAVDADDDDDDDDDDNDDDDDDDD